MIKRTLFAIPALVLLVSSVYFGGLFARIVVAAVGVLCMHEMLGMVSAGSKPLRAVAYGFAALSFPAFNYAGGFAGIAMLFILSAVVIFTIIVLKDRDAKDGFMTVFSIAYPGMFYAFLIALSCVGDINAFRFLMIIVFASAVITDSFAYFTGMLIGRHKLAPSISPKKTVEGAIGGTFFGICAVYMFGFFGQGAFGVNIPAYWYLALGAVLSILAQIGDLAASKIKRHYGVKDFGRIMGTHGGAMDRLDSMLFVVPAVYAFYGFVV